MGWRQQPPRSIHLHTPYIKASSREVWKLAFLLGVDPAMSCSRIPGSQKIRVPEKIEPCCSKIYSSMDWWEIHMKVPWISWEIHMEIQWKSIWFPIGFPFNAVQGNAAPCRAWQFPSHPTIYAGESPQLNWSQLIQLALDISGYPWISLDSWDSFIAWNEMECLARGPDASWPWNVAL